MRIISNRKRDLGKVGEDLAVRYLIRSGLRPIVRNYHCKSGEIDLVAYDQDTVVFVEVRLRHNTSRGSAVATVTSAKQRRIGLCARHFLMTNPRYANYPCRFDIVGISVEKQSREKQSRTVSYQWLKNAFEHTW